MITHYASRLIVIFLTLLCGQADLVDGLGDDAGNFMSDRRKFVEKESSERTGGSAHLSDAEIVVNKLLLKNKNNEVRNGRQYGNFSPSLHFFKAKSSIENSEVFKFIKKMPKGAVLHAHDASVVDVRWLIRNATYQPHCYMCYTADKSILFRFSDQWPSSKECSWQTVAYYRHLHGNDTDFDIKLYKKMTIVVDDPASEYKNQSMLWSAFEKAFSAAFGLVLHAPIFRAYLYEALSEFYLDGVMYLEIRCLLAEVYELEGTTHNKEWVINTIRNVTQHFIREHPDFQGVKIIYSMNRKASKEDVMKGVKEAIEMRHKHADIVAGFDLVGREDQGNSLLYYIDALLYPAKAGIHLPFFFHAGETDWQGIEVDGNLVDAVLLNSSRIGHGYAITKHPEAIKMGKEKSIAIEINPISNQVLGLVSDLRNHPGAHLLATGYPVVISCDDPAMWGAVGLSYDFYEAFMGLAGADAGLSTLKQLAINSIKFSAMTKTEKEKAFLIWQKKWNEFIKKESVNQDSTLKFVSFKDKLIKNNSNE